MSAATVIITCYNLEQFVGAAIESALGQDCTDRPEIIVVDDCSTDNSERVIRSYPVRYVRTVCNGGSLLAMLKGIEQASHDIICLLDGDDIWRCDKLRKVSRYFASEVRTALVTHDLEFVDALGRKVSRISRPRQVLGAASLEERSERIREGILMHEDYVWLGSALSFRRSLARIDEFAKWVSLLPDPANTYQDWPLAFWIAALHDIELGYISEQLLGYRVHGSNHSGDASTPDKAIRNIRRARNTVAAMCELSETRALSHAISAKLIARLRFLDYLIDLYSGRRWQALRGWLQTIGYVRSQHLLSKESARFFAIQALGPSRFASCAGRRWKRRSTNFQVLRAADQDPSW